LGLNSFTSAPIAKALVNAHNSGVKGVGIFISNVVRTSRSLSLGELRALWPGFHPPQGFRHLDARSFELLRSSCSERRIAA
jgi:hypothetical protein